MISILIPEHSVLEISVSLLLCVILGIFAYWRNILDVSGATASFVIGLTIAIFANIYWLITLICFLVFTYVVTRLGFSYKLEHGVAQGKYGERSAVNAFANGAIPALIAVFRFQLGDQLAGLLFICSISVAASDSFANEVGVLSKDAFLITNLRKRVRPGTDGGVSRLGQKAAILGAFIPAIFGWVLISDFNNNIIQVTNSPQMAMTVFTLIFPIIIGFLGCQVDSILGATLQRRKIMTNDEVNFFSVFIMVIIAGIFLFAVPIY